jgi:glycosyltransferase involved in cell wall biosynthesis
VAFDIPCLREVVTPDRGRLVPPDDIDAFAAAWLALLSDPACCRALGLAGARYAETMRWADVADRQARAYAEVLDG